MKKTKQNNDKYMFWIWRFNLCLNPNHFFPSVMNDGNIEIRREKKTNKQPSQQPNLFEYGIYLFK